MADAPKQTVIEDGTEFDGMIRSRAPIVVSGTVKGELQAPALSVSPSGHVHGRVKVEQLVSQGEISGEIEAKSVELAGTISDATVIQADRLEVKLHQPDSGLRVTFGTCELRVGAKPAKGGTKAQTEPERRKVGQLEGEPVL
jgi:cytoskeletal protein CcmA (bactofilin family)